MPDDGGEIDKKALRHAPADGHENAPADPLENLQRPHRNEIPIGIVPNRLLEIDDGIEFGGTGVSNRPVSESDASPVVSGRFGHESGLP